jgi:hypothetical protein
MVIKKRIKSSRAARKLITINRIITIIKTSFENVKKNQQS